MYFVYLVGKIYGDLGGNSASELVAIALAHALALFAAVSASINVSGGHVNPAVTFGTLLGGRISVVRAIYYWIAQLLGSIVAALLLRLVTNMVKVPTYIYICPESAFIIDILLISLFIYILMLLRFN